MRSFAPSRRAYSNASSSGSCASRAPQRTTTGHAVRRARARVVGLHRAAVRSSCPGCSRCRRGSRASRASDSAAASRHEPGRKTSAPVPARGRVAMPERRHPAARTDRRRAARSPARRGSSWPIPAGDSQQQPADELRAAAARGAARRGRRTSARRRAPADVDLGCEHVRRPRPRSRSMPAPAGGIAPSRRVPADRARARGTTPERASGSSSTQFAAEPPSPCRRSSGSPLPPGEVADRRSRR